MTVLLDMGCSLSLNKQCSASRRVRQEISSRRYVSRRAPNATIARLARRPSGQTRNMTFGCSRSSLGSGPAAERRRWGHRRYSATAVGATAEYLRLVVDC